MVKDSASRPGHSGLPELRVLRQDEWNTWYDMLIRAFGAVAEAPEERELWN